MNLVIDANILFALLIKHGKTEEVLFQERINAFAPEFLLEEFQKYEYLILKKTSRSHEEFQELMNTIKKKIKIIPNEETKPYMKEARKISPDKKDTKYFATALMLNCAIWSNDRPLKKQEKIRIYTTNELIRILEIN